MAITNFGVPGTSVIRQFWESTKSITVPLSANGKTMLVWCCGESGYATDPDIAVILVSNGKYIVFAKGSNISISQENSDLIINSVENVSMAIVEV